MSQTWKNKVQLAAFSVWGDALVSGNTAVGRADKSEVTVTAPVATVEAAVLRCSGQGSPSTSLASRVYGKNAVPRLLESTQNRTQGARSLGLPTGGESWRRHTTSGGSESPATCTLGDQS